MIEVPVANRCGISVTGNRVSFTPNSGFEYAFCFTKGIYCWKVSGRSLALTKVSDKQCPARIAVFMGVWKRLTARARLSSSL